MIKYLMFFLSLVIAIAGYSQPEFVQNKTYYIKKVVKANPANAEKIWMKCSSGDIEKLEKNSALLTSLTEIAIVGGDETDDWGRALGAMSKIASLRKIIFINNYFNEIPVSTALLKQISSIDYYGAQQTQYDSCIATLEQLPNLKEISFDLFWIDDIPSHLYLLKNLQSVAFRFSMNFNQEDTVAANEDTTLTIADANRSFSISLTSAENSLTTDDIHDMLNKFPASLKVQQTPIAKDTPAVQRILASNATFNKTYQNIHPPVANLTEAKTYYSVKTDTISTIQAESGSIIKIPSDAFVDENGAAVTGQVIIDYREFKDPIDFIFSGIPMSFDSGSQHSLFKSAGMFEINASVNGKEVFLKKGKKIDVDFTTTDSSSGYSLFSFNDSTGRWKTKQKSLKMSGIKRKKYVESQAVDEYYSMLGNYKQNQKYWTYGKFWYDSTLFNDRFTDTSYVSLWKKKWYNDSAGWSKQDVKNQLKTSNIRITDIRKSKDGTLCFYLYSSTRSNPELNTYHNSHWKLSQKLSKKELKAIASSKNHYNDVRIEEGGGDFVIKLKTIHGFVSLRANPVRYNQYNYTISLYTDKELTKLYKRYSKLMASRERIFNRNLIRGKLNGNEIPLKREEVPNYVWRKVRNVINGGKLMTIDEKALAFGDWKAYALNEKTNTKGILDSSQADAQSIIGSFSIDGMGVWNCDQVQRLQNPIIVYINYENKSEKSLSPTTTYIINKNLNGILSYRSTGEIAFSGTSDNVMLAINSGKLIAVSLPDDFKNRTFINEQKYPFLMDEFNTETTSVAELKKLMGYK